MWKLFSELLSGTRNGARRAPAAAVLASSTASAVAAANNAVVLDAQALEDRFLCLLLSVESFSTVAATLGEQAALQRFRDACNPARFDLNRLPRLPAVLPELLRMIKNGRVSGGQMAELIARDPVLLGEVIRMANSVHYRTSRPIESLPQAVVMLGEEGLRRVVANVLLKPIHQGGGTLGTAAAQHLLAHAECCGQTCAALAKDSGDPFEAYLAGMACNAGAMPIIRLLDQDRAAAALRHLQPFATAFSEFSAQLSFKAAAHWQFPVRVLDALAEHAAGTAESARSSLGKVLLQADRLSKSHVLDERPTLPV